MRQAVTAAAAINDVGSWALVSWQATFYQRVYDVGPETYAPALAVLLPVGGLLGGVGGGLLADRLTKAGKTALLTSGAPPSRLASRSAACMPRPGPCLRRARLLACAVHVAAQGPALQPP